MSAAAAVAAMGLALVAAAAAPAEEPIPTRDCRSRADPSGNAPLRFVNRNDLVVGPVSFTSLKLAASRTTLGPRGDDGRWFRKTGAKVLWGRPVTVTIPASATARVALAYSRGNALTSAVRFEPCPPGTPRYGGGRLRRVTMFNGGFSLVRPGCYPVEVRVEGRAAPYRGRVPLGRPCR
jgi:hypothetical protein